MHPIFQKAWEEEWDASMPVGWVIDRDYISRENDLSRAGLTSRGWNSDISAQALVRFRLLDDDGEIYYGGSLVDDDECMSQDAALAFGANDAGCTHIQVKRDGKWIQEIS